VSTSGWPPPWTPGPAYPRRKPIDGVSVAALITGILWLWPVALVCGLLGIRRTRNGAPQQGRGLAIAGTILGVLGAVAMVLIAVLVTGIVVVAHTQAARNAVGVLRGERLRTADLDRGDCFKMPVNLTFNVFSTVAKQDCSTAHSAETIARSSAFADGPYPGTDLLRARANSDCEAALVEIQDKHPKAARLQLLQLVPSHRAWTSGRSTIVCAVIDPNGPIIGPLTDFPRGLAGTTT
jgi:hypothetical protein